MYAKQPDNLQHDDGETVPYDIIQTVENGIERITYQPHEQRYQTPIVMQHGMWHGAWCWSTWQAYLASQGWVSHAHSLPGHGQSPTQRNIRLCTLGYYLRFLKAEMQRHVQTPILMGHSMGGALTQWYLKKVADDLPAAVLVASWNSHEMMSASLQAGLRDPMSSLMALLDRSASPYVLRTPQAAKTMLINDHAIMTAEQLHSKIGPESMLVLTQYNPPLWAPLQNPKTPLLWILPDADKAVKPETQRRSAIYYGCDVIDAPDAAHNVMMDANHARIAQQIHEWFLQQKIR